MTSEFSPWTFDGENAPLTTTGPLTTLVEGRTLSISSTNGDILGNIGPQGFFFLDTRLLQRFELKLDGRPTEVLGTSPKTSYSGQFISRHISKEELPDQPLVVVRSRFLEKGLHETIEVRNYGKQDLECRISLNVESDFADLFAVKESRVTETDHCKSSVHNNALLFTSTKKPKLSMTVTPSNPADTCAPGEFVWLATIPAQGSWTTTVEAAPTVNGNRTGPSQMESTAEPTSKLEDWFKKVPVIKSDSKQLENAINQAMKDLASLRIFDSQHPDRAVIAAGAPWFMTLFGRDSLITAWMSMFVDPDLASGVLQTLADFQGTKENPDTEEEPGKIMHEIRFTDAHSDSLSDGDLYYGTADATALFVMLLGELDRWGESPGIAEKLLPQADKALDWIENYGDKDGDGYVEYQRSTKLGLANQGWKDSGDGIRYGNGEIANAPIALSEVQAYTYSAYRARARFAEQQEEFDLADKWENKARELRRKFNQDFWNEEKQCFVVGLDRDKKQIDSLTSNTGHCLWTGIVDEEKAPIVAKNLMDEKLFNGWGIRTLSNQNSGYNPTGYHTGSVWPHDSAIAAAGLMRYGFIEESHRIMTGLLDLSQHSEWRLPELTAGFSRAEFSRPIAYPASCSPQAWSAASTLLILRWILRIDPWCSRGRVWIDPVLPEGISRIKVDCIRIGGNRVSIEVEGSDVQITGLPEHLTWRKGLRSTAPRAPRLQE